MLRGGDVAKGGTNVPERPDVAKGGTNVPERPDVALGRHQRSGET